MDSVLDITQTSYNSIFVATVLLAVFVTLSLHAKHPSEHFKRFLFGSIVVLVLIPTLYVSAATIYTRAVSANSGPVHWHADIEVWNCGKEVDLVDPVGILSDKIGTPMLHEHNDKRMHVEGVLLHPLDASLGKFFNVIGGKITSTSMLVPTNNGKLPLTSGSVCDDGKVAQLQVFVYQTNTEHYYSQMKITDPARYVISPYTTVPKGDCIIVEYGPVKDHTDKLCQSYQGAKKAGIVKGEW